jgi:TolB-like protein/Flp pilus assembly protein TadD
MSPEQARGRSVDRRADVWAFGCLMFECLSGRQVFSGDTVSDTIARILEREPDWNLLPPSVPARVRDLLRRCLTKPAEDRPRDLGDLGRELNAIALELSHPSGGVPVAADAKPSLAVLYFENLANDPDSEYFCSGITEDILTDLSKIKGLRVASRNAVQRYRGAPADLPKVAADLGVGAVLEGSVRRAGDRVRITAQLVSVRDGFQLWAERYDRTMNDVFAVQEEIASSIAEALRVALSPAETAKMAENRPQDVRAYDLYLRGRQLYGAYTDASLHEALEKFRAAVAIDPDYALAWAGIADTYGQLCQWGRNPNVAENTRLGLEAARRAVALNPRLPEAHKAEALILRFAGDRKGVVVALQRAIDADPKFTPALINLTVEGVVQGDLAAAERYTRRALEADPQETFAMLWLTMLTHLTRRGDEALAVTDRIRRASDAPFYKTGVHMTRALIHLARGDIAGVERARREGAADAVHADDLRVLDVTIAVLTGRADEARGPMRELAERAGITAPGLMILADMALRIGEPAVAGAIFDGPLVRELAPTLVRLQPALHTLLDSARLAPRRSESALVWPLEAPMLEPSVHPLFREVRIESGRPPASQLTGASRA